MQRVATALALALAAACAAPDRSVTPDGAAPATAPARARPSVTGTAPANALVILEPEGGAPLPEGPAVLDQYGKQFVPAALVVRVGQRVEFRNSEDISHNVQVKRAGAGTLVFNVSTDPGGAHVHVFDQAGRYEVTCDLHPGMASTLYATTSPYHALAGADWRFSIADVPPGRYTAVVLAGGRETRRPIETSGARTEIDLKQP